MINIEEAKRLIKRTMLANIATDKKDLALTPLISGKHGIGKSQMIKSIANDIDGVCITIEGGTLKEGEITGLPYQYEDNNGEVKFKFLPYYAIDRIQQEEKKIYLASNKHGEIDNLTGDENKYSLNDIPSSRKIEMLLNKEVRPVIIFIDEINRTENTVYKELMNILLTRSVNGYQFPWWVFFVGAMNPSTQNSLYSTNEMDPAQLDRFIKIKVGDDSSSWIKYAKSTNVSPSIINFIKNNPKCLSSNDKELDDEEKPTPSPRGWDMVDTLLKSIEVLKPFFNDEENSEKVVKKDLSRLISAKLGGTVGTMFEAESDETNKAIEPSFIFDDDEKLTKVKKEFKHLSSSKKVQTCDLLLDYLKENIVLMVMSKSKFDSNKNKLSAFVKLLDPATRLLFAQKLSSAVSSDGSSLIDLLFDIFESDLIEMLDLSEKTKELIKGSK